MTASTVGPFLRALAPTQRSRFEADTELEARLDELWRRGAAEWPDLEVTDVDFAAHVAGLIPADADAAPADVLASMRAGDLVLCLACGRGDSGALRAFDDAFKPEAMRVAARARAAVDPGEFQQALWTHLLVAAPDQRPRILEYGGRGKLRSWLRTVGGRLLIDMLRSSSPADAPADPDAELAASVDSDADPEIAFMKERYRDEFRVAFDRAFASLTSRQRNFLRHRYLHDLSSAQIADLYGIARGSVSRTLGKIHSAVLAEVRRHLLAEVGVGRDTVDSLVAMFEGQLEISLRRLLATTQPEPE